MGELLVLLRRVSYAMPPKFLVMITLKNTIIPHSLKLTDLNQVLTIN
nr:MAG TPA: hypothetical protein [Caudoviricetes sp.]